MFYFKHGRDIGCDVELQSVGGYTVGVLCDVERLAGILCTCSFDACSSFALRTTGGNSRRKRRTRPRRRVLAAETHDREASSAEAASQATGAVPASGRCSKAASSLFGASTAAASAGEDEGTAEGAVDITDGDAATSNDVSKAEGSDGVSNGVSKVEGSDGVSNGVSGEGTSDAAAESTITAQSTSTVAEASESTITAQSTRTSTVAEASSEGNSSDLAASSSEPTEPVPAADGALDANMSAPRRSVRFQDPSDDASSAESSINRSGNAPVSPEEALPTTPGQQQNNQTEVAAVEGATSLPYGGDLQAAMKAQDRSAIKQIMTFNNKAKAQEIESPNAVVEVAAAASADPGPSSDDRASLPHEGNLQAAMKAQDRGAIKQIMAFNNKAKAQENESPPAAALEVAAVTTAAAASADSSASPENASSALPYGGDLQAAMKAQDRSAIKEIMASKNKAKALESESPPPAAVEATAVAAAASPVADLGSSSGDVPSLPYGGDLQVAMKAQDSSAIKQITASRNASKE